MRRRAPLAVRHAVVVAALGGLLAGCGGSKGGDGSTGGAKNLPPGSTLPSSSITTSGTAPTSGATAPTGGLTVRPSPAHPHAQISFSFMAPAATGTQGKSEITYSLSVTGPSGHGCVGVHEAAGPSVTKGQVARISVGPAQLKRPWCTGPYTARVFELSRPACSGGQACPQYIRVVAIVGSARFRVTAG